GRLGVRRLRLGGFAFALCLAFRFALALALRVALRLARRIAAGRIALARRLGVAALAMCVLAVIRQVEARALEHQPRARRHPPLGDFSAFRTRHFRGGVADLAKETLELVAFGAAILVSRHSAG